LHQEPNQLVHLILIFDHQVNGSCFEAKTQALPGKEWMRLPLSIFLLIEFQRIIVHRNQVLPKDPESRRSAAEKNSLNVGEVASR
jgi:hypothetical protein